MSYQLVDINLYTLGSDVTCNSGTSTNIFAISNPYEGIIRLSYNLNFSVSEILVNTTPAEVIVSQVGTNATSSFCIEEAKGIYTYPHNFGYSNSLILNQTTASTVYVALQHSAGVSLTAKKDLCWVDIELLTRIDAR